MGQDIEASRFSEADFTEFEERLRKETDLLAAWLADGAIGAASKVGGFELEAWLVGPDMRPAPVVEDFLRILGDPLVVPELATFNAELNGTPQPLSGDALSKLAAELSATWERCTQVAARLDARLAMIGILPTVRPEELDMAYMTPRKRYQAINEQIFDLRHGRPMRLEIQGRDHLVLVREDVMTESAATSFQIHLKVTPEEAHRVYNLSKILSAPMVAVSANSPYLFGCDLWHETRIPLFEQAVSVGSGSILSERVNFGVRYAEQSVMECFRANLVRYPVILPHLMDEPMERLAHLRLHNGTIWRWNRPLIGFDDDGAPHLRIEHRVVPAGPSVTDAIANAALYFGAVQSLLREEEPAEAAIPFLIARANFYTAARDGLAAEIQWLNGRIAPLGQVFESDLLPRARTGLIDLGIDRAEADYWLGVIGDRVTSGQTGAVWQRAFVARHGKDMTALTAAYLERQQSGLPVHQWTL
jgi:gamma-glutamyl:cysteine ligase YbdK (ATP-grasp superfamily)